MPSTVDYERQYARGRGICGEPMADFVAFFDQYEGPPGLVLDLGCGQGRDALLAARQGHRVIGVDLAPTGIAQMLDDARSEGLDVTGIVADVSRYVPPQPADIVLLDRVLHLLPSAADRRSLLERLASLTTTGGHVLIADTRANRALIRGYFDTHSDLWHRVRRRGDFLCARRGKP